MTFESLQPVTLIAGMALLTWVMMRRKVKRKHVELPVRVLKTNVNMPGELAGFQGTEALGAPAEVLRWQVELHDMARELKAELDSKMLAVTALSRSYDQATKRLSDLIRLAEQVEVSPTSLLARAQDLQSAGLDDQQIVEVLDLDEAEAKAIFALLSPVLSQNEAA